jgi:hypothetical protein
MAILQGLDLPLTIKVIIRYMEPACKAQTSMHLPAAGIG